MIIVGIDWARCKHDYLLMAPTGQILQRGRSPARLMVVRRLSPSAPIRDRRETSMVSIPSWRRLVERVRTDIFINNDDNNEA